MASHLGKVLLYTDGSCLGNPGPGGWAYLVVSDHGAREDSGSEQNTTNNRIEMKAAIEGLNSLHEPCGVTVISDSRYLISGATELLVRWQQREWRTSNGTLVQNQPLWQELVRAAARHRLIWQWVPGHSGVSEQEYVDRLAGHAAREQHVLANL